DDRFSIAASSDAAELPRDAARVLAGHPGSLRSYWLLESATRDRSERELHTGFKVPGESTAEVFSGGADWTAAVKLPLPAALPAGAAASTTVCQVLTQQRLAAVEPGYPLMERLGPGGREVAPDALRIIAGVPENLARSISAEPMDAGTVSPDAGLLHTQAATEYGTLGTGGAAHDWRLSFARPAAPEPDALPTALQRTGWRLGRTLNDEEIARAQFRPDRFQLEITRELQEAAERIKHSAGLSGIKLLERLRLAVIAYVPEDRPDWRLNAAAVLRTGIGSRAILFLALARALQLAQPQVVPAYLVSNPNGPGIDAPQPTSQILQQSWQTSLSPRHLAAAWVTEGSSQPRIVDLSDYAPGDGPGVVSAQGGSAHRDGVALLAGGTAVLAGELPAAVQHRVVELPSAGAAETASKAPPPLYEVFEIQLNIAADGKAALDVAGSWDGPAAQRELLRSEQFPRMGFASERVWRVLLTDFPLAARPSGAVVELPGWDFAGPQRSGEENNLARLAASETLERPGLPGCNSFNVEAGLDGTAYARPEADGRLSCNLPLRRLPLSTRWAPLSERRQDLLFTEWRMAREFVHIRAVNRAPAEAAKHTIHLEFKPLILYDLEITPGPRQRWDATRTLRIRPGVVAAADYPRFKRVLEQIEQADATTLWFKPAP
ncbi:MAG TPA: hypothetical protein VL860_10985, partial [Planctomycetota bacterium]|nr:hypothetical protein [Planctomycetota bacterium]